MILNDNILLCANDYCQDPAAQLFAYGDIGTPGLPITNLLDPTLYTPAEFSSTNVANTWFTIDLQKVRSINMIALLKHNLTYVAQWRVRIYDADPSTNSPIYDSSLVNCFPTITGYGGLFWGDFNWGGSVADYAEYNPVGFNRHTFMPLSAVYGRYIRIDISDPSNPRLPKVSRTWISKGYQPTMNATFGSDLDPIDETEVSKSRSGVRHYGRVTKRKQLTLNFELIPRKELLFNIFGPIHLRTGKAGEMLVIVFPSSPDTWFYESVFGNMPDLDKSVYSFYDRMDTTITVEEAV